MDFEWTNQNGPVDPQSPFIVHSQQSAKKREQPKNVDGSGGFQSGREEDEWELNEDTAGPHSVLDSPSKSGFATPNRLREPNNQHFYFAQEGSKPLPLPPHVQSDAWAPRTPASTYDFSSGGETPNTPAVDSDAGTPDTSLADKMGRMGNNGEAGSPKKAPRRESWLKRMIGSGSPSPTKPAAREKDESRSQSQSTSHSQSQSHYSHKAEHRIQKKRSDRSERSRSKKRVDMLREYGDDSDNELALRKNGGGGGPMLQDQGRVKQTYAMSIAGFLHWVEAHPNLPSVLSYYMQLTVNIFLATGFMYVLYCAWQGVMSDVDLESSKHMSEVLVDIAICAKNYKVNRCDDVVPHLEKACGAWKTCMDRDPKKVARASVTAKTFAMIFNSFVEEFSYKSMVCLALFAVLFFYIVTFLNARFRKVTAAAERFKHIDPAGEAQGYFQPLPPRSLPDRLCSRTN
jgi:hypothetical protein